MNLLLLAAALISIEKGGIDFKVESDVVRIDPSRSVFLTVSLKSDESANIELPDLRERVVGFSIAEDFAEEPVRDKDGKVTKTANWKLVPEPCAAVYKIKPFAIAGNIAGPVYFEPPAEREPVTGAMEVEPKKDLPPLSWKLVGLIASVLVALSAIAALLWLLVRWIVRKIREHRMSPIERAWVELDRLIKKGLPGRGRYKDFYVELTMVVRRYVQRKYGIKAPHLTTEEFLREIGQGSSACVPTGSKDLERFLESADMVKFAGVEATPEMADEATDSARKYLKQDGAVK
jgi:hypothetical protein